MLTARVVCGLLPLPAALLISTHAAAAETFPLPDVCKHGATGDEGDDPVVLISQGSGETTYRNFSLLRFTSGGENPKISWGIMFAPYVANTYNVFTTYTPFLTSDRLVEINHDYPSLILDLPAPGISGGRNMTIHDTYVVTIFQGTQPVPNAYVDFIPAFDGSSPLTMQADSNGRITLNCLQEVSGGYRITVYDSNHQYLYDGYFPASSGLNVEAAGGGWGTSGRSQADPPQ